MSFLYVLKRRFQRNLPQPLQRKFQEAIYFALYRLSPARHQNFFNSGFSPADEALRELPPFDQEPLQATLYDQVLWSLTRETVKRDWNDILDIGCGLGGGMRVAARRFPDARIAGVDVNGSAVSVCRKTFARLSEPDRKARQCARAALRGRELRHDFSASGRQVMSACRPSSPRRRGCCDRQER